MSAGIRSSLRWYAALFTAIIFGDAVNAASIGHSAATNIQESSFVTLGGIEQWVTIRGGDTGNPILLVVHGGPGDVLSPHVDRFAPYESEFIVVQWDQRGAGRTYGVYGDETPRLTLDRVANDGIELAEYLSRHLEKDSLIVLGHSWGTVIATEMVTRRPELFSAYVGTGQIASWARSVQAQFDFLETLARQTDDEELSAELAAMQPLDPMDLEQFGRLSGLLRSHLDPADAAWLEGLRERASGMFTEQELSDVIDGMNFSGRSLISTQMEVDLFESVPRLEVPLFVIQGHADLFTPTRAAVAYFEHVDAPLKALFVIDEAGHFALVTHQAAFRDALLEITRTLSSETGER